jgi:hypothetical protein
MTSRYTYHSHDLSLHLPHTRENIRMDWIRNGEFPKSLRLQPYQLLPAVIDSTADPAIFPPCMLHIRQLIQLFTHRLFAPSFARQAGNALDAGTARNKFALEFEKRFGDLCLHFVAHAGKAQEDAIEIAADVDVEVADGAEDAAAFQLVEGDARPAEEE